GPLPCLTLPGPGVPAIRWATTRPGGLAATECRAGPARGPLSPPAVHPATRTATAPSNAPTGHDRARAGQAVIAPSPHGSSATPLTRCRRDRFHRAFSGDQDHWLGADPLEPAIPGPLPGPPTGAEAPAGAQAHGGGGTHNLPRAHLAVAVLAGLL